MPKEPRIAVPTIDLSEDESLTIDEALAKVAIILARSDKIAILTELDDREIKLCAALYTIADRTKDVMIANFLLHFLELRVSKARKGRSELLEIAKSAREQPEQRFSRLRNLFGGGNRI